MEEKIKKIKKITEGLQWFILIVVLVAFLFMFKYFSNRFKEEEEHHLYEQINREKQIQQLNTENTILTDSLTSISEK